VNELNKVIIFAVALAGCFTAAKALQTAFRRL
jgi:hypothetical protein